MSATLSGGGGGAGSGGAIAIGTFLDDTPVVQGISSIVGSLGGLTTALGVASAAMAGLITKEAIEEATQFETELADLAKVLGNREMARPIAESIAELSTVMPIARKELSAIAEQAVRFGIRGRDNIVKFTKAIGEISIATDATASQASEAMVKIAAVTQEPIDKVRRMGDVLNRLSNTAATSFSELIQSAGKLAPMLSQMDVNTEDIFALAAATNEVNISVRRGARRLRSFFQDIRQTKTLEDLAQAMGTTSDALIEMVDGDQALQLLVKVTQTLQKGGKEARELNNAFTRAAGQGVAQLSQNMQGFLRHISNARQEMDEGGSLADEYAQRVNTAAAKQQLLNNQIQEAQRELGTKLNPTYKDTLDLLIKITSALQNAGRAGRLDEVIAGDPLVNIRDAMEDIVNQETFFDDLEKRALSGIEKISIKAFSKLSGQIADIFGKGGEAAREAFERQFFNLFTRVPQSNRQEFKRRAENIITAFSKVDKGKRSLDSLFNALSALQLQLSATGEEAEQNLKVFEDVELPSGEFAKFEKSNATLLQRFRQETKEIGRTEEEILRLKLGYSQLSAEKQKAIDGIIRERQERQRQVKGIKRAKQQIADLAGGYIRLGNSMIQTFTERAKTFNRMFQQQQREILSLEEGELQTRLYEIEQSNLNETQKQILKTRARTIAQLNAEKVATEETASAQERMNKRIRDMKLLTKESQLEFLEDSAREISSAFVDMFNNIIEGSESAGDAMVEMIRRVAQELAERQLRAFIFETLLGFSGIFGGGGGGGTSINPASGVPSSGPQFAASGASASPGELFVVGEEGPEFFVPSVAGNIVPPEKMDSGGKTEVKIEQSYTIQALDSRDVGRVMDDHAQRIAANTVREIRNSQTLKRGMVG